VVGISFLTPSVLVLESYAMIC